jgi:hypothetical protein
MLFSFLLAGIAPQAPVSSILAVVPDDAYALVHCRDIPALRSRVERNDWCRLLGMPEGGPFLRSITSEFGSLKAKDSDSLWAIAGVLAGETVLFDTGSVAGFVTEPTEDRKQIAELMHAWLPNNGVVPRRTVEIHGATVEFAVWTDALPGRTGHIAAFVNHPNGLALYSGNDEESLLATLTSGITSLGSDHRAPLVASYLTNGGAQSRGVEAFIDFAPFLGEAERALENAVGVPFPKAAKLLGLDKGTWAHLSLDVFPGKTIDARAHLHIPPGTLSAKLADTFLPLAPDLSVDLPRGSWGLLAVNWDIGEFYQRLRQGFEEAQLAKGIETVDQGIGAAKALTGVDLIDDVLMQFAGDFAIYLLAPPTSDGEADWESELLTFGFQAGLKQRDAFQSALETLLGAGFESYFTFLDLEGAEALVLGDEDHLGDINGGIAFFPKSFTLALSRANLRKSVLALSRVENASVESSSLLGAAIGENQGACFLTYLEMTPLRRYWMEGSDTEVLLPPLEEGQPARDPFDAQLIGSVRRTGAGFELRVQTR